MRERFEPTAETERLEQSFDGWLNRYYATCRELLGVERPHER
jgi:hypothetical protein